MTKCFHDFFLKTVEDYRTRLNNELLKNGHDVNVRFPDGYQEAPLAYDAVWAVALGMNLLPAFVNRMFI